MKLLKENPDERLNAKDALQHPWFNIEYTPEFPTKQGAQGAGSNLAEFNQQRKRMILAKNPLPTCTPVMAGIKRQDLPPETPFM